MNEFDNELRLHLYTLISDKKIRAQEDVIEEAIAYGFDEDVVRKAMAVLFKKGALTEAPVELLVGKVKDFEVVNGAIELVLLPQHDEV